MTDQSIPAKLFSKNLGKITFLNREGKIMDNNAIYDIQSDSIFNDTASWIAFVKEKSIDDEASNDFFDLIFSMPFQVTNKSINRYNRLNAASIKMLSPVPLFNDSNDDDDD